MIKFFRRIRQKLLQENRFSKYLIYAIGEIILVVIGILIALQINNSNEAQKIRKNELAYLNGIKSDLQLNTVVFEESIIQKESSIVSANIIIGFFEGKPIPNLDEFNFHNLNVQIAHPITYNNNTYQELVNSGNLAIISNDSIKTALLNMESVYREIQFWENHMYTDFKENIYHFYFGAVDLNTHLQNYAYQVSKGQAGENRKLSMSDIEAILANNRFKNGFVLAVFNNGKLLEKINNMNGLIQRLNRLLDDEIKKD
jgi:hypothetical protein